MNKTQELKTALLLSIPATALCWFGLNWGGPAFGPVFFNVGPLASGWFYRSWLTALFVAVIQALIFAILIFIKHSGPGSVTH